MYVENKHRCKQEALRQHNTPTPRKLWGMWNNLTYAGTTPTKAAQKVQVGILDQDHPYFLICLTNYHHYHSVVVILINVFGLCFLYRQRSILNCYHNPLIVFSVILLAEKQTSKQTCRQTKSGDYKTSSACGDKLDKCMLMHPIHTYMCPKHVYVCVYLWIGGYIFISNLSIRIY